MGLDDPGLAPPPPALEEEVDPFVDRLVVALGAVHGGEGHEIARLDGQAQLLGGLPEGGRQHRLTGLHMAGRRRRPPAVAVAGVLT